MLFTLSDKVHITAQDKRCYLTVFSSQLWRTLKPIHNVPKDAHVALLSLYGQPS